MDLVIAIDLNVGPLPEIVQVLSLLTEQTVPPGLAGHGERGVDLVAQRLLGSLRRPTVGDVLDDTQTLPWFERDSHRYSTEVGETLGRNLRTGRPLHQVIHGRSHRQLAVLGAMHEFGQGPVVGVHSRAPRRVEH